VVGISAGVSTSSTSREAKKWRIAAINVARCRSVCIVALGSQ
jgi:hypothetical protein